MNQEREAATRTWTHVYVASLEGCCLTGGAGLLEGLSELERVYSKITT